MVGISCAPPRSSPRPRSTKLLFRSHLGLILLFICILSVCLWGTCRLPQPGQLLAYDINPHFHLCFSSCQLILDVILRKACIKEVEKELPISFPAVSWRTSKRQQLYAYLSKFCLLPPFQLFETLFSKILSSGIMTGFLDSASISVFSLVITLLVY